MSYTATATATKGIVPTSLNLNVFSQRHLDNDILSGSLLSPKPKMNSVLTDDEDIFSLDMVTMDMNFDQAYLMYTLMQHKNALLGVQQLQQAQQEHALVLPERYVDDMDQFFSNTESSALDGFLDSLALLLLPNTNAMYAQQLSGPFALHTMTAGEQRRGIPDVIKNEITDAFKHPPVQSLKSFGQSMNNANSTTSSASNLDANNSTMGVTNMNTNVMSNMNSVNDININDHSTLKDDGESMLELLRKKRKINKSLLLLEQKRLNHLHSEQKRRLMCKEAYERCLRLVTNVDDYKNDLVLALAALLSKKKLRRKQINKDGLPNLLKHTALCKIAAEIEKISAKNSRLRELLEGLACA